MLQKIIISIGILILVIIIGVISYAGIKKGQRYVESLYPDDNEKKY